MRPPLSGLLHHVIDYAGTFPPAQLELPIALANYRRFRLGPPSFLTGRLVWPASKLADLENLLNDDSDERIDISVIGTASTDRSSWEDALTGDAAAMNAFSVDVGSRAEIVAYEVRVPDHENISTWLRDLRGFDLVDLFVELPWGEGIVESLAAISELDGIGAKARTGGTSPTAFPVAQSVAQFIHESVSLEVPFKLTAGLHQPLWHRDEALNVQMHGFLNMLTATALAITYDASTAELVSVLQDGDIANWRFDHTGFDWRGHRLDLDDIEDTRALFVSFGSCEIDEPIREMQRIGMLEDTY